MSMKSQLFLVALIATLASPTWAQLGPAGVPGAPGLAETDPSVKTAPVAPPTVVTPPAVSEPDKKAVAECQPTAGKRCKPKSCAGKSNDKTCKSKLKAKTAKRQIVAGCDKASDPAVCREHERVRKACAGKQGDNHRQCLREQLTP